MHLFFPFFVSFVPSWSNTVPSLRSLRSLRLCGSIGFKPAPTVRRRGMTLYERYEEALAAWHTARSQMLSDRLTLSRKEAQMHEADVEQDDRVADYFANRRAEMARR